VQADGRGEVAPCRLEQHDRLLGRKASDLGQGVQRGLVAVAFEDVSAAGRGVGGAVVLAVSRREDEHRGRISAALGRAHVPEQSIRVVHDPSRPGCILWRDGSRELIRGDCPLHLEECLHGRRHIRLRLRHEEALHLAREFSRQPLVLLHSWEGQCVYVEPWAGMGDLLRPRSSAPIVGPYCPGPSENQREKNSWRSVFLFVYI